MFLACIAQYLHDQNVAVFDPTGITGTIFLGMMPSTPDQCIGLFETPATLSDPNHGYDTISVQVRTRGTRDIRSASTTALAAFTALQGLSHYQFPNDGPWLLKCTGYRPYSMGVDSNGRHEYVSNFQCEIRNESLHRR